MFKLKKGGGSFVRNTVLEVLRLTCKFIIVIFYLHMFEYVCEIRGCLWRPGPLKPELQVAVS